MTERGTEPGGRFPTPFVTARDEARYLAEGLWTTDETLPSLLRRNARQWPDRLAVVDDTGQQVTHAHLREQVQRLATALRGRGVEEGDVVGVQLPNRVEAVITALAVQVAGAVVCPLVTPYRLNELSYIVHRTSMKALVVPGVYRRFDHDGLAGELRRRFPHLAMAITLTSSPAGDGLVNLEDLMAEGTAADGDFVLPDARAVTAILFTSGTESDPKGVLHTHNTLLANLRSLQRMLDLGDEDSVFMASPLGHGTGYGFGTYLSCYLGSTLSLLGTWEAERAAEMLSRSGSVYTHGATPFVQDLLSLPGRTRFDLSRLRYFVSGGASVPPGTAARVSEVLGCRLLRLYGQTEGFMSTLNRLDDPAEIVEQTDGRPVPGVEVRVVDEEGHDVAPGAIGECVYRGPHRCVGFLDDKEREASSMIDGGWLRSGDLVQLDDGGCLTVAGRKKEVINRGGYKYSPREVEEALARHPDIERVAVVRMDDSRLVERACAFVVPRGEAQPTVGSLGEHLGAQGIASFKWPERVEIVAELPMTPSGKIQKFVLEARLRQADGQPSSADR